MDKRLDSWKAIADYLGRDRSTVIRWERESGLPVKRVPGGRGRSVFAYSAEIDEWLASATGTSVAGTPPSEPPGTTLDREAPPAEVASRRPLRTGLAVAVGAIVVLAIGITAALAWRSPPALSSAKLVGKALVGLDTDGRELWRYSLPAVDGNVVSQLVKVGDIDQDGAPDVLAALHFFPPSNEGYGQVLRLDNRGRLLWAQTLEDRYAFGETEYGPGWYPDDMLAYRVAGVTRIAVAFHHHTWWPDVVATLDSDGRIVGRFVHAGWITALNLSTDGRWLLAGGISNAYGGSMLAVLDAANAEGTGPMDGGSLPGCLNCPGAAPHKYVVVPWSDIARPSTPPPVHVLVGASGTIELRAVQRPAPFAVAPELIFTFTPGFDLLERKASDGFAETHAVLERAGELTHPFAVCPSKTPAVRVWAPAGGWREIR